MCKPGKEIPMIAKSPHPTSECTYPSDSESELVRELEEKRKSIDEEISQFQVSKEKEFRDFEQALRSTRRRKHQNGSNRVRDHEQRSSTTHPKRTSSSSALDLLAGHGASQILASSGSSSRLNHTSPVFTKKNSSTSRTGPLPSKPTLSVDALNINGEKFPQSPSNLPSTPTLLSRSLSQTSLSSKDGPTPPTSTTDTSLSQPLSDSKPSRDANETFVGILTPSYLPLLGPVSDPRVTSSSPLVTPPADENADDPVNGLSSLPTGVLPLQSSSFPPHVTVLSPASTATKRAYTAPATTQKPSALRSASAGNLAKKRKHVTFRLADSAIVDPGSSYEEGPSPIDNEEGHHRSRATTAVSHSSRKSSSLRHSNVSPRNGLISDHTRSDEEDEAAGVKPGMSMDEVMQKLNSHFTFDDDEDVGWTDTKYHEDEDEDDDGQDNDYGMDLSHKGVNGNDLHDDAEIEDDEAQLTEDHSEEESDSYFSPKFHEMTTVPTAQFDTSSRSRHQRDRSGSSPLTPLRDQDWDALSSSDKDRLLFSGRGSDSESDHRRSNRAFRKSSHENMQSSTSGFGGLKKTGSTNSLSSMTSLNKSGSARKGTLRSARPRSSNSPKSPTRLPRFEDDLGPSIDGGSGIGFFELDEELASPEAGKVKPFCVDAHLDIEANDDDSDDDDDDAAEKKPKRSPRPELSTSGILGTGMASVPINITRPSTSVSSSWVGTFGH